MKACPGQNLNQVPFGLSGDVLPADLFWANLAGTIHPGTYLRTSE